MSGASISMSAASLLWASDWLSQQRNLLLAYVRIIGKFNIIPGYVYGIILLVPTTIEELIHRRNANLFSEFAKMQVCNLLKIKSTKFWCSKLALMNDSCNRVTIKTSIKTTEYCIQNQNNELIYFNKKIFSVWEQFYCNYIILKQKLRPLKTILWK